MSANFIPKYDETVPKGRFRFWCQKTLPLVYDDSLSYYELLCKVVDYLNTMNDNVNTLGENTDKLYGAYEQLQTFVNEQNDSIRNDVARFKENITTQQNNFERNVNKSVNDLTTTVQQLQDFITNYFDNLDVQEEINNKLDALVADGTMDRLLKSVIDPLLVPIKIPFSYQNGARQQGYDGIRAGHEMPYGIRKFFDSWSINFWVYLSGGVWSEGMTIGQITNPNEYPTKTLRGLCIFRNLDVAGFTYGTVEINTDGSIKTWTCYGIAPQYSYQIIGSTQLFPVN